MFRGTLGGSKNGEVVSQGSEAVVRWSTWSRVFSTAYVCANILRLVSRPWFCRTIAPVNKSRRFRIVVSVLSCFVFLRALRMYVSVPHT